MGGGGQVTYFQNNYQDHDKLTLFFWSCFGFLIKLKYIIEM
jgi:hypothetical protein